MVAHALLTFPPGVQRGAFEVELASPPILRKRNGTFGGQLVQCAQREAQILGSCLRVEPSIGGSGNRPQIRSQTLREMYAGVIIQRLDKCDGEVALRAL